MERISKDADEYLVWDSLLLTDGVSFDMPACFYKESNIIFISSVCSKIFEWKKRDMIFFNEIMYIGLWSVFNMNIYRIVRIIF